MAVIYLDEQGSIVTAPEFWARVERISLESESHPLPRAVGRDFASGAADADFAPKDNRFTGWRDHLPGLGSEVPEGVGEEPEATASG
jgi:hypothetical protein